MKIKNFFKFFCKTELAIILMVIYLFFPFVSQAEIKANDFFSLEYSHVDFIEDPFGMVYASGFGLSDGGGEKIDLRNIVVNVVKYILSFTGIIAVSMILVGGFKFMVAGGNADTLSSAKNHLLSGIIGLVIIITSYTLVGTVVSTVESMIIGHSIDEFS